MPTKRFRVGVALAMAAGSLALPSVAAATCPTVASSQVFAKFGDTAYYSLAPGGGFETGMTAWTYSGAKLVAGNEPWYLRSSLDKGQAQLAARGVIVSPAFCVSGDHPTMRLTARQLTGRGSALRVEILYGPTNAPTAALAGYVQGDGTTGWRVSNSLRMATALPLNTSSTGTMTVRLRISADLNGSWAVDDVFVDPLRR